MACFDVRRRTARARPARPRRVLSVATAMLVLFVAGAARAQEPGPAADPAAAWTPRGNGAELAAPPAPNAWALPALAPDPLDLRVGRGATAAGWAGQGAMAIATAIVLREACEPRFTQERCSFRQIDGLVLGWFTARLTASIGSTWMVAGVYERALHLRRQGYDVDLTWAKRARWVNALGFAGLGSLLAQRAAVKLDRLEAAGLEDPRLPPPESVFMPDLERPFRVPRRMVLTVAPLQFLAAGALIGLATCHVTRSEFGPGTARQYCYEPFAISTVVAGAAVIALRGASLAYSVRLLRRMKALRRAGWPVSLRRARAATAFSLLFPPLGHALARSQRDRLYRFGPAGGSAP
ncbi:MAG: hypothetical protein AAGH15_22155 [Myxococcota bacterium]